MFYFITFAASSSLRIEGGRTQCPQYFSSEISIFVFFVKCPMFAIPVWAHRLHLGICAWVNDGHTAARAWFVVVYFSDFEWHSGVRIHKSFIVVFYTTFIRIIKHENCRDDNALQFSCLIFPLNCLHSLSMTLEYYCHDSSRYITWGLQ